MARTIRLVTDTFPGRPEMDVAISRALLLRASQGAVPETFRLHVPGRILAFGKRDTLEPGYRDAVAAAAGLGFDAVERLAGGRAAVFHEATLAFSWSIPDTDPRPGIGERFEVLSQLMVRAFDRLGVAAEVGEIPGEYCPGAHSVHHAGRFKLMGVGQRLARHAAHVGGVVVVADGALVRRALVPVYDALQLTWDPTTAGSLQDAGAEVTPGAVAAAIRAELQSLGRLEPATLDAETLELAGRLAPEHVPATRNHPTSRGA